MSDEVERTKRVRGKTTPAFIKFNYTEETSNLDNKTSEAALVLGWIFFSLSLSLIIFSPSLEETAILPITTIWMKI